LDVFYLRQMVVALEIDGRSQNLAMGAMMGWDVGELLRAQFRLSGPTLCEGAEAERHGLVFPGMFDFHKHLFLLLASNTLQLLVGEVGLGGHRDGVLDAVLLAPQIVQIDVVHVGNVPHATVEVRVEVFLFAENRRNAP